MAKVKITGHASGSGVFTITAPNSNTDRTITLPDASVTLGTDATKLPLAGGAMTGAITTNSTFDGVDIATRDGVLTSTTATAAAALPKAGGTMTGNLLVNNGSSAKLGIGTSPSHMLHVVAPASIGDYAVKIDTPDRYGLRIEADGAAAAYPLIILDGSTAIFTVKGDGRGLSQFTAKFWCNWNQVGTQAVRDSHNISSISDHAVGATNLNFANNVGDASGAFSATGHGGVFGFRVDSSVSRVTIGYRNAGDSAEDTVVAMAIGFGD